MILPPSYYQNPDVLWVSQDLLGKFLMTKFNGILTGGMIVETEAYKGPEDRASHAYNMRRTKRNEVMYWRGGYSYVYLCYGIHYIFNVITNIEDIPHGVMLRSIEPVVGIDHILKRRNKQKLDHSVGRGPGSSTQALGITTAHNGESLQGPLIWIEDRNMPVSKEQIVALPRIGIDYAKEDALLPWRYKIAGNPYASPR